jgi:hypothetical protein
MRTDIRWIMDDLAKPARAPKATKRKKKEENEDEENEAEGKGKWKEEEKGKGKGPAKKQRQDDGNDKHAHRNNRNANPTRPTKKPRATSPSRSPSPFPPPPNLPPPEWSDFEPLHTAFEVLKGKLKRYWKLHDVHDALPSDLRLGWKSSIEKWGTSGTDEGIVLKELCKLACMTRSRHEEVVKKFRELVARRKGGKKGLIFGDIEEVRAHFTPPVEMEGEETDVDDDEKMHDTSEEEGEDRAPRLPSRPHFSPDTQYGIGVQHTASQLNQDASGSTQRLQGRSNSLATATYELDVAINAISEAEALLEHAKNRRAQVLSDARASQMDILQAKLAVSQADQQLCIANENVTLMKSIRCQNEVS